VQVFTSPEVGALLDTAVTIAVKRGNCFVGVDHVFEAVLERSTLLPATVLAQHTKDLMAVGREMAVVAWTAPVPMASGELFYTPRAAVLVSDAAKYAEQFSRG